MRLYVTCALAIVTSAFAATASADTQFGPWRHLGPNGGAITGIVFDRVFPNIVVVATSGGVYRSIDNGDTWRAVGPWGETLALAAAPSNHLVLYASSRPLSAVMKSTDGGVTWATAGASVSAFFDNLAVDPTNSQVVYTTGGNLGLFRSIDGGVTWLRINQLSATTSTSFHGIRIDPANPLTIYAFGSNIFKSTDGGASWTDVKPAIPGVTPSLFTVFGLEIDPRDSRVLTATFAVWGIYRSTDGGASWAPSDSGIPGLHTLASQLSVAGLAVDPLNPSTLYVTAYCVSTCPSGRVFKSIDGGVTWTDTGTGGGWSPLTVAVSRSAAPTVLVGFDCADSVIGPSPFLSVVGSHAFCTATLTRSTNGGAAWSEASTGLTALLVPDLMFDPVHGEVGYAATGRGVFKTVDGGVTWNASSAGLPEGFLNGGRLAIGNGGAAVYVNHDARGIFKSTNGGASWALAGSNPVVGINVPVINQFLADPASDTLFAGTPFGLFRSTDGSQTWTQLASGSTSNLRFRPGSPSTLFYTIGATLFITADAAATSTTLPLANVTNLALDPSGPQRVWATATVNASFPCGSSKVELFRSDDNGTTWSYVSDGPASSVPAVCSPIVTSLVVDPANSSRLVMGVFMTSAFPKPVYMSNDGGVTWSALAGTLSSTVRALRFSGSALFAATNGDSIVGTNQSCPMSVSATAAPIAASGGQGTLNISTIGGCAWTLRNGSPLVSLQTTSGFGDAAVAYVAAENAGAPRSFTISVNELTLALDQRGTDAGVIADATGLRFTARTTAAGLASTSPPQLVQLIQAADGTVPWRINVSEPWIAVSPAAGVGATTLSVSVVPSAGLPRTGEVTANVIVQSFTPAFAQEIIPVTVNFIPLSATPEPFGVVDTPIDGANGMQGSLAISGWALDDRQVTRVRVLRDSVAGEPAGLVFVGNAALIDGARPDVAAAFSSWPLASRAGWGYLLLSNMLPNQGNGTFRFTVIADDADGHSTVIGVRTIVCDNADATAPFGAIDTPGQGDVVSGLVANYGWVLSPGSRRSDPPGGGSVTVFVDGAPVGSPGSWNSRSDLSSLFPVSSYSGIDTALGVFGLDTASLANGLHTISWSVTDNLGATSGVGSRFFTVSNASNVVAAAAAAPYVRGGAGSILLGRRGFDLNTPLDYFFPGSDGVVRVDARELDRIELQLEPGATGVLITPQGEKPLPIGAQIDPATGVFTWAPGAGFVGAYDFALGAHRVRIVLHPK